SFSRRRLTPRPPRDAVTWLISKAPLKPGVHRQVLPLLLFCLLQVTDTVSLVVRLRPLTATGSSCASISPGCAPLSRTVRGLTRLDPPPADPICSHGNQRNAITISIVPTTPNASTIDCQSTVSLTMGGSTW